MIDRDDSYVNNTPERTSHRTNPLLEGQYKIIEDPIHAEQASCRAIHKP